MFVFRVSNLSFLTRKPPIMWLSLFDTGARINDTGILY